MSDVFHRISYAEAGPRETGKLLEVIEPYLSFSMDRRPDEPLALEFSLSILSGAFVSNQWLSGATIARQKKHAEADGNDDLCLLIPRRGKTIHMHYPGRRHGLDDVILSAEGHAQLWGNDERYESWSLESDNQVICVPRSEVSSSVKDLDDAMSKGVPRTAALDLLSSYARTLASDLGPLDGGTIVQARKTLTDLFILALGPSGDATEASKGSVRTATLERIKADIDVNLAEPAMSLGWIAGRHGLAPRAIRDLFYAAGTNFTDHVLSVRLARAHTLLSSADQRHRNITAIAYDCGFGDLSWFNQAFRRRYAMTPSDLRSSETQPPPA